MLVTPLGPPTRLHPMPPQAHCEIALGSEFHTSKVHDFWIMDKSFCLSWAEEIENKNCNHCTLSQGRVYWIFTELLPVYCFFFVTSAFPCEGHRFKLGIYIKTIRTVSFNSFPWRKWADTSDPVHPHSEIQNWVGISMVWYYNGHNVERKCWIFLMSVYSTVGDIRRINCLLFLSLT